MKTSTLRVFFSPVDANVTMPLVGLNYAIVEDVTLHPYTRKFGRAGMPNCANCRVERKCIGCCRTRAHQIVESVGPDGAQFLLTRMTMGPLVVFSFTRYTGGALALVAGFIRLGPAAFVARFGGGAGPVSPTWSAECGAQWPASS